MLLVAVEMPRHYVQWPAVVSTLGVMVIMANWVEEETKVHMCRIILIKRSLICKRNSLIERSLTNFV